MAGQTATRCSDHRTTCREPCPRGDLRGPTGTTVRKSSQRLAPEQSQGNTCRGAPLGSLTSEFILWARHSGLFHSVLHRSSQHYPYSVDEETEGQRGSVTCGRPEYLNQNSACLPPEPRFFITSCHHLASLHLNLREEQEALFF